MLLPRSPLILTAALAALSTLPGAHAGVVETAAAAGSSSVPSKTTTTLPCTASSTGGAFYDLRPDIVVPPVKGAKPKTGVHTTDYAARGHDYGANFTLNICAAVVAPVTNVVGVDRSLWANVSAYYEHNGDVISLGQQSSTLVSRGRELVLQYTGGSPCPDIGSSSDSLASPADMRGKAAATRRKSATFAFLCDRDPLETTAHVSFVGTPDQCAYFFKIRSPHACAIAEPHKPGSVGPGGVFAIIFGVALMVYFAGGIVYNRTIAHARGWRQLPNYTIWLGIWKFVRVRILCCCGLGRHGGFLGGDDYLEALLQDDEDYDEGHDILRTAGGHGGGGSGGSNVQDTFIILTSSCARFVPHRQGYQSLSTTPGSHNSREDENRLIDQLDEEWDD